MASPTPPSSGSTPEGRPPRPELFHAIADEGSAAARRRLVELGITSRVSLRNVTYPEVEADLRARGGGALETPALWQDGVLIVGEAAVLAALERIAAG